MRSRRTCTSSPSVLTATTRMPSPVTYCPISRLACCVVELDLAAAVEVGPAQPVSCGEGRTVGDVVELLPLQEGRRGVDHDDRQQAEEHEESDRHDGDLAVLTPHRSLRNVPYGWVWVLSTVMPPSWDPSALGVSGSACVVRTTIRTEEPGWRQSAGEGRQVMRTLGVVETLVVQSDPCRKPSRAAPPPRRRAPGGRRAPPSDSPSRHRRTRVGRRTPRRGCRRRARAGGSRARRTRSSQCRPRASWLHVTDGVTSYGDRHGRARTTRAPGPERVRRLPCRERRRPW